jgi:ATP-binding protein involved in chromosome partitioning
LVDPRINVIDERLKGIKRIVAVSSGKGGVGKSLVASTLALALAKRGYKVGLFDLDFTSPSTHIILNVKEAKPKEDKGIVPPRIHGLEYMSIIYYSGEEAAPLRGIDVSNVLIELFSITRWGKLDFLVLDMPPGISDATLDLIRLVKRIEFLLVTTSSQLAFETLRKLAGLLGSLQVPLIGVVENMKMTESEAVRRQVERLNIKFLGEIPFDSRLEEAIGSVDRLSGTVFAGKVQNVASKIRLR